MLIWICIGIRILANPFSNVIQKLLTGHSIDPWCIVCVTHFFLSLACLPLLLFYRPPIESQFWWNICLSACLCVGGNVLIIKALQKTDLSILGPINAYKSVISMIPSLILLGEFPAPLGLIGILLIVAGSYFLAGQTSQEKGNFAFQRLLNDRGVQYRLAALGLSAIEAVFLKMAMQTSSWMMTFACWCVLGLVFALLAMPLVIETTSAIQGIQILYNHRGQVLMLSLSTGLMQICTNYVLQSLQVSYALALFQTSSIVSVFLGYHVFREQQFLKRLLGSLIMVFGAILVVVTR